MGTQQPPIYCPYLLWPNGWMHQDATWYGVRPQPRRLCVRWGPSSPSPKTGLRPQFSAHVYCGQTVGWIKMPLGTEVCFVPGDIVLDGDPAPPKRAQPSIFLACLLWPNGCMYQETTWYGGRFQPRRHCVSSSSPKGHSPQLSVNVRCGQTAGWTKLPLGMQVGLGPSDFVFDGDPAASRKKAQPPPNFWLMSIVAKRLDGSRYDLVQR